MHLRDPLIPPLLALLLGVLAARAAAFETAELAAALAALAILSIAGLLVHARFAARAGCLAALACAGALTATVHRLPPAPELDAAGRELVILAGCVVGPPAFSGDREQFLLELEPGARAQVNLYVREGEPLPPLQYGQRIELEGRARKVRNFRNPGSFDFERYMARQEIYWTVSARADSVRVVGSGCGSAFRSALFAVRTGALARLERLYPGDAYGATMMKAILIGDSANLEKSWTEDYRRTGTYHALVISGLHVTVLAAVLLFLLRLCSVPEGAGLVFTVGAAWIYALVSGWTPPVVRAAAGFTLFAACRCSYRRGRVLNLLAAVAVAFVALDPEQVVEASFQLSFLSVAAIGALAAPLLDRTVAPLAAALPGLSDPGRDIHRPPPLSAFRLELRLLADTFSLWTRVPMRVSCAVLTTVLRGFFYAVELVVISAAVQVGLALPMASYFHRISITGLSANVVIVPLLSLVVPVGFAAVLANWGLPAAVARGLLRISQAVAGWHAGWEPPFRIPDPPFWLALAYGGALLLTALVLYSGSARRLARTLCAGCLASLLALVLVHPFPPKTAEGSLELTMIDVGQGDSLLVVFPDRKTVLLDAGGVPSFGRKRRSRLDIGEDVVSPYLWSRSIRRLDAVILSHAHEDHAGGLAAVMENFRPKELWATCRPDPIWQAVAASATRQGVRLVCLAAGRTFPYGGAAVQVLAPPAEMRPSARAAANDDSLVLRVGFGRHSFLLTGDAERLVEAALVAAGTLGRSEVLKIAHHGGRNSSSDPFLDAVRPALALISAGFENSYNMPAPRTLERLAAHGAAVLRTDTAGLTTVWTDGRRLGWGRPP